MKKTVILIIFLFTPALLSAEDVYVRFEIMRDVFYNRLGQVIVAPGRKIAYSKNPNEITYGGQWIEPELPGVDEKYRHGGIMIARMSSEQASVVVAKDNVLTIVSTNKVRQTRKCRKMYPRKNKKFNYQVFNPTIISNEEAKNTLITWGVWIEPSGVTD